MYYCVILNGNDFSILLIESVIRDSIELKVMGYKIRSNQTGKYQSIQINNHQRN